MRLVVSLDRGLEVVIPRGFDRRQIPGLLEDKRDWIERTTARMEARRGRLEADPPRLPERISLPAVGEEWEVEYRPRVSPAAVKTGAVVRELPGWRLVVTGDPGDHAAAKEALCRWLRRRARRALVPRLMEIARQHGLEYERVSLRQQRTRWASCSRQKTISLNTRLLFLPPDVVDYVLLHELCHTVEMNHSPRFWALLETRDPHYRTHKKLLRNAGASLPAWLDHDVREPAV